jgi:hypothetical protein
LEYDFAAESLPVGLGGSWTGGCEPWRKGRRRNSGNSGSAMRSSGSTRGASTGDDDDGDGPGNEDDELTLVIETDLTCLLRNSLWLHNQSLPSCGGGTETASSVDGCKATGPSNDTHHQRQQQQHQQHQQQLESSSTNTMAVAADAAAAPTATRPEPLSIHSSSTCTAVGVLPRAEQPEDERNFRRKRDAVYSKRKRERKRIELEVLQHQELHLGAWNDVLRAEGNRLEELIRAAHQAIEHRTDKTSTCQ